MKRFISAALSAALMLGSMQIGVYAEISTGNYAMDTATKTISKVAPLTTVAAFKSNFSGAEVEVVNVNGEVMADTAYATENVFAKIDGVLYSIDEKYGYEPIANSGLADGTEIYNVVANAAATTNLTNGGFVRIESVPKIGYGTEAGYVSPENTAEQTLKATKSTRGGEGVYVLENDSNKYSLMRSHYSSSANYSTTLNSVKDTYAAGPVVTAFEFEADKLGNISVFHNTPVRNSSGALTKGDATMDSIYYGAEFKFVPSTLHFLEDGSVKLGGIYANTYKSYRTPAQETDFTWEAGKKYNVSIVQRYLRGKREGYVDAVYVNGVKIFPNAKTVGHADGRVALQSDGSFKVGTKDNSTRHGGDISSVLIGTAPKTAGENLKVYLSDIKVYGLASTAAFNGNITKENVALYNAENVTVSDVDAEITDAVAETVADFKAKYQDMIIGVYNADGTAAGEEDYLATGMSVKIASEDGLQGRSYKLNATKPLNTEMPESAKYTVDTEAKKVSGIAPLTTVKDFLANFENGSLMRVVNIDGSTMSDDAFATENVYLKDPKNNTYEIVVKYPYAPIATDGKVLADGRELYNEKASVIDNKSMVNTGFEKVQVYAKLGYGSGKDEAAPENTDSQTVKAVKASENGAPVYVLENDSSNYAYLRSHYSESTDYSTTLNNSIDSWSANPIITTVEFEADKLGNVSLFNNTPVRDGDGKIKKGDSGVDGLIYSVEAKYAPNSVHFLEDGSVKLGGIYANYDAATRAPIQETDFTWEPGKKYTVSIVQRYLRGKREGYVDAVYVNGEKIFPNSKTVGHSDGRVALQADGSFKIGTKDSSTRHGGGLSSIMIGTAPKTENENFTVTLSDVKVYGANAYNAAFDKDIVITSNNKAISVDNDNAVIYAIGAVSTASFDTTAKLRIDGKYLKAVSADGLVAKTYKIVTKDIDTAFLNGENGNAITTLAEAGSSVCYNAVIDMTSMDESVTPLVILALYKGGELLETVIATGESYNDEVTSYKAVLDISGYNKSEIEICGFTWDSFNDNVKPLTKNLILK